MSAEDSFIRLPFRFSRARNVETLSLTVAKSRRRERERIDGDERAFSFGLAFEIVTFVQVNSARRRI